LTWSLHTEDGSQVFTGPTVDEALRAARAAYGPHVQVGRALRVVSGVRGLLGQARYCVEVRPAGTTSITVLPYDSPADPLSGDPVRSALDELLDAAEERERGAAEVALPDEAGWSFPQQREVDRLLAELGERVGGGAAPGAGPRRPRGGGR